MSTATKTTYSLAGIAALIAAAWTIWPALDGLIFFEAEASDTQQLNRRQHYETRHDVAELQKALEPDEDESAKLQAEVDYYRDKIRELDEGEK